MDAMTLSGQVEWELSRDGTVLRRGHSKNLVTQVGDRLYAERGAAIASPPATPTGMKLGTGSTSTSKAGAGAVLTTYLTNSHLAFDATYPQSSLSGSARRITYICTFPPGKATSVVPITEAVIVNNALTDATSAEAATIARCLIVGVGSKGAGETLTVTWTHDLMGSLMASYTIFGSGAPTGMSVDADLDEISVATEFYVLAVSGWRCAGVRIWIPAGATLGSGTKKAYLWTSSGAAPDSIIATADFSGFVAGAWNTVFFSSPVSMVAGKYYWAQVYLPDGGFGFKTGVFSTSPMTSSEIGSLYAAGTGEANPGQGSFRYGAAGSAPTGGTVGTWYGVDVVVDDGVGSVGPGSSDTVGLADTITVVRSGLASSINASATATDPLGLTASDTATFTVGGPTAFHTNRRNVNNSRISWGSIATTNVKGPSFAKELSGPLTLGLEFYVTWPVRFVGCYIYKAPDATGSIPVRLWDRQGTGGAARELGNTTVTWVADAGGWREITFSVPIDLTPNILYTASYYSPSADYCSSAYVFYVKSLISTPIVIPPFASSTLKGGSAFRQGTAQVIPDINSPNDYYIDPIVEWDSDDPVFVPDANRTYYDQWVNGKPIHKFLVGVFFGDPPYIADYAEMGVNAIVGAPGTPDFVNAILATPDMEFHMTAGLAEDPLKIGIRAMAENPAFAARVPTYYVIDEPDQFFPYSPPETVREWCRAIRLVDSTRPLYMGLGRVTAMNQTNYHQPQGSTMEVANELWRGWAQLGDVLSGDYYNMSPDQDLDGNLGIWTYPAFVRRLREFNEGRTPIYIAIETTSETANYPIPEDVRKCMWACIIEGCQGFELFDHRFGNALVARDFAHMLHNPPMKSMMTAMIARINSLVDAILGPDTGLVTAWTSSNTTSGPRGGTWGVPMHYTTRFDDDYEYLFAMGIRPGSTTATFTIPSWAGETLTVIDESRTVTVSGAGVLTDTFLADYSVHLYRKG